MNFVERFGTFLIFRFARAQLCDILELSWFMTFLKTFSWLLRLKKWFLKSRFERRVQTNVTLCLDVKLGLHFFPSLLFEKWSIVSAKQKVYFVAQHAPLVNWKMRHHLHNFALWVKTSENYLIEKITKIDKKKKKI